MLLLYIEDIGSLIRESTYRSRLMDSHTHTVAVYVALTNLLLFVCRGSWKRRETFR